MQNVQKNSTDLLFVYNVWIKYENRKAENVVADIKMEWRLRGDRQNRSTLPKEVFFWGAGLFIVFLFSLRNKWNNSRIAISKYLWIGDAVNRIYAGCQTKGFKPVG